MDDLNLIKTVRGLDQTGTGKDGQVLKELWTQLAAKSASKFYAAEESILRWLLKSMNGTSESAEILRRYPLAWAILGTTFERIPAFSLAKSLADRRFMTVLQQSLKDVAHPTSENSVDLGKRKRSPGTFQLSYLRTVPGCLDTADTLFQSLFVLVNRVKQDSLASSHDKIGAEHIRSLFSTTSTEAMSILAPAFNICKMHVVEADVDDLRHESRMNWIDTLVQIWDLHLQGSDDVTDVATHLSVPVTTILSRLSAQHADPTVLSTSSMPKWQVDLEKMMHRNFVLPARAAFITRQDFGAVTIALEVGKHVAETTAPVIYALIAGASTDGLSRKQNDEWAKRVFEAVEKAVRACPQPERVIIQVLGCAAETSLPIRVDDLRGVCTRYGLRKEFTNWDILAKCAKCNPAIFQSSEAGSLLLRDVCQRSLAEVAAPDNTESIQAVIQAILQNFLLGRDLMGFLKLWFSQLCVTTHSGPLAQLPWQTPFPTHKETETQSLVEKELSVSQVLEIVKWVATQEASPEATTIFADAISQQLQSESYVDPIGRKLYDLVKPLKLTSPSVAGLRWSIAARSLGWLPSKERDSLWEEDQDKISRVLRKGALDCPETLEAFKCCCQAWVSMSPDGPQMGGPAKIVHVFTKRLTSELGDTKLAASVDLDTLDEPPIGSETIDTACYAYWYLRGCGRLIPFYAATNSALPAFLAKPLFGQYTTADESDEIWNLIMGNENLLNNPDVVRMLIDRVITILTGAEAWSGNARTALHCMSILNTLPADAWDRPKREQILTALVKRRAKLVGKDVGSAIETARIFFSLLSKLLSRSTYVAEFDFQGLLDIAGDMDQHCVRKLSETGDMLAVLQGFSTVARKAVRQMGDNVDERSAAYFQKAHTICQSYDQKGTDSPDPGAFVMVLMHALISEADRLQTSSTDVPSAASQACAAASRWLRAQIDGIYLEQIGAQDVGALENETSTLRILAMTFASKAFRNKTYLSSCPSEQVQRLEMQCKSAGFDTAVSWKMRTFLQSHVASRLKNPQPIHYGSEEAPEQDAPDSLLTEYVQAVVGELADAAKVEYVQQLIDEYRKGHKTDAQLLAIHAVLKELSPVHEPDVTKKLATTVSDLVAALNVAPRRSHIVHLSVCLEVMLDNVPGAVTQWSVESILSAVCKMTSAHDGYHDSLAHSIADTTIPHAHSCKLVSLIVRKHRHRLEGRYHMLITVMQALLRAIITADTGTKMNRPNLNKEAQETHAKQFARLVTLICEPTASAVSRSQQHGSLDSATSAAKRAAGRHMYLLLMYYVKAQLESPVAVVTRTALEPAMNSIFDITPPDVRKILNDAMDSNGRAILREMFTRYTKIGRWTGV